MHLEELSKTETAPKGITDSPADSPMDSVVIDVQGISAHFHENRVLEDVTFQVRRGEIFVVVGESGCGKSTLLRSIIGLYRPDHGRVLIQGTDIVSADEETLMAVKRRIGVLFQSGALIGSMTLAENIALPLKEHTDLTRDMIDRIVRMKLRLVQLSGYEEHLPSELSGGMKKRAGIARAMALDPQILFLDELSAGLDPVTSAGLDKLVKDINAGMGTTMLIVSHELNSIMNIADRVIMLDKTAKGIIAEGDPRVIKETATDPRVYAFFNREVGN
jgi:phospholipid/cholesterol/gamma-HCH transport system ATP-binding protein